MFAIAADVAVEVIAAEAISVIPVIAGCTYQPPRPVVAEIAAAPPWLPVTVPHTGYTGIALSIRVVP